MKPRITLLIVAIVSAVAAIAGNGFDERFDNRTLRLDYIFAGNDSSTAIYFKEAGVTDGWAGRRHNLEKPYLRGNGSIAVIDPATGDTIYTNSFAPLFQEWQHTAEAQQVSKAFEATMLVPFPREKVDIAVDLFDNRGNQVASLRHPIDPADILIRRIPSSTAETRYMHRSGSSEECIDIAIVAEGYTASETEKFFNDARRGAEAILSHEPFASMKDCFNILAVATTAGDSGPDVPREGVWNRTAHRSHYDTFYSDRYLTTPAIHEIFESVAGLPIEHIILLVNTPRYGGGGLFNQVTVATSDHPTFKEVLVHEFGHAYGGLADEYFYDDDSDTTYATDVEPWEPNITTLVDFDSKWADLVDKDTPVPTPIDVAKAGAVPGKPSPVGAYEGAGYRAHGIYRPVDECRMRVNSVDYFCPVCSRAIVGITNWYLGR